MTYLQEKLQEAQKTRDDRCIIGGVIGFVIGLFFGMDGVMGLLGAVIVGWLVYTFYDGKVEDIQRIIGGNK